MFAAWTVMNCSTASKGVSLRIVYVCCMDCDELQHRKQRRQLEDSLCLLHGL